LVKPGGGVTIEFGVSTPAHLAKHILRYVLSKERLDMSTSVAALENQLMVTSYRSCSTQLREEELKDMILCAMDIFTNFSEVCEDNLLRS
jgi:Tfp pilus assembly PilM family ATPase